MRVTHVFACAVLATLASAAIPASAQDLPQITVRPLGPSSGEYVGPYGRSLPGVQMFAGRPLGPGEGYALGGVRTPSRTQIENENTYQDPLPILDGWHGTLSDGIPF